MTEALRSRPRYIGDCLLVPAVLEIDALERSGDLFKETTGRSFEELNYDFANPGIAHFDERVGQISPKVPFGSLIFVEHLAEDGTSTLTCLLQEEDSFIFYSYPPGCRDRRDPDYTGTSGSLSAFLTPNSHVVAFVAPSAK